MTSICLRDDKEGSLQCFSTIKELVALATEQKKPISEIMIEQEMEMTQQSREYIWEKMEKKLTNDEERR